MKVFLNILKTIIAISIAICGVACLIPLISLYYLIYLPCAAVSDIWSNTYE